MLSVLLVVPLLGTPAAAADDPVLSHRTSWLGETTLAQDAAHTDTMSRPSKRNWVQTRVKSVFVDPQVSDGTVYTNSVYDEMGKEMGVYQYDAANAALRPITQLYRQGAGGTVVTGDDKYLYADFTRQSGGQVLVRFDRGVIYTEGSVKMSVFEGGDPVASEWKAGRNLTGKPGGVTTGRGLVFVTRPDENAIYVYEREKMTLVAKNATTNPGAVAFRHSTNTLFVLADEAGRRVVQEWRVEPNGAMTKAATVTDVGAEPVALAANDSRLYIADNALAAQQVRIYSPCVLCPQKHLLVGKLGQAGGVVKANGEYADDRFDNLTGVGVDSKGNVYVAANARGTYGWTDIRRFSPTAKLEGKVINYVFQDTVVPDPRDPSEVYSAFHRYKLNYAATTPGQEWAPERTRLTVNRSTCPHDGRTPAPGTGKTFQTQSVALRHLKGSDGVERKYLFVRPIGSAYYNLGIYRFDETGARPSVLFSEGVNEWPDGTPPAAGHRQKWVDTNANCRVDTGEISEMTGNVQYISYAHSTDDNGDIWGAVNPKHVHHFPLASFDSANNPQYGNGSLIELKDLPMDRIQMVHHVAATDTMYIYGALGAPAGPTASPKYILARYDNFTTNRTLAWRVDMAYKGCWDPQRNTDHCIPNGMAVAGNRVYVADLASPGGVPQGKVRTYDAGTGTYKGSLYAGPEVAKVAGWVDIAVTGITATVLPSGEHVVFREEDALGRVLMYRYKP